MSELALPNDRFGLCTDVGPLAIVKWIGLVRLERQIDDFDKLPLDDLRCVYRNPDIRIETLQQSTRLPIRGRCQTTAYKIYMHSQRV